MGTGPPGAMAVAAPAMAGLGCLAWGLIAAFGLKLFLDAKRV